MNIAIAGGSGFIGRHLAGHWMKEGHRVVLISRSPRPPRGLPEPAPGKSGAAGWITWEDLEREPEKEGPFDAVVNLAGESINQRWTREAKERIRQSRLAATERIAAWIRRLPSKPEVVVNASAIGIYGTSLSETFTESGAVPSAPDFLAGVVRAWEEAADRIEGARVVKLRIGVVLAPDGGALKAMALPYRLGLGGPIGNGRQWLSWIHVRDLVRIADFCVRNRDMQGPVNAVAPVPVTIGDFGGTLGRALRRPHFVPAPAFALRLLFGEMSMMLLEGQRVLPDRLLRHGFDFEFPTLDRALSDLLGRPREPDGE